VAQVRRVLQSLFIFDPGGVQIFSDAFHHFLMRGCPFRVNMKVSPKLDDRKVRFV